MSKITKDQFLEDYKKKYPVYIDRYDDEELFRRITTKYPERLDDILPEEPEKPSLIDRTLDVAKNVGGAVKDVAKDLFIGDGGTKAETPRKTLKKPTIQPVIPEEKVTPQVGHTVGSWLNKYAPATDSSGQDNNQSNYLRVIKNITGADPQTPLNQVNIDSLAQAVAKQEGYYQSPENNLASNGRETNLPQEWYNMGMLEYRGQEGATPSDEVLDAKGNVLYPEGRFAVFATEEEGFNALKRQLAKDQGVIFSDPSEDGLDISFRIARNNALPTGKDY